MITQEQIPAVLEHPVYDAEGSKIGDANHVFFDDATGRPEWVSIKTGFFGTSESFVPIRDAVVVEDHLEVPYPKAKVKDAPNVDVDSGGHLSEAEEVRLYEYYGMAWDDAWQQANRPGGDGWARSGTDTGTDTTGTAGTTSMGTGTATGMGTGMGTGTGTGTATGMGTGMGTGTGTGTGMGADRDRDRGMDTGTGADPDRGMRGTGDGAMTRSEEHMHVGAERYETGRARLRKYVVTEEVQQTVPLRHEEVRLEREPITDANRGDAMAGPDITEAEHEVTLHAERPVVQTEAVPVERVRLNTEEVAEEETVTGEVRKERIAAEGVETEGIEDMDDDGNPRRPL